MQSVLMWLFMLCAVICTAVKGNCRGLDQTQVNCDSTVELSVNVVLCEGDTFHLDSQSYTASFNGDILMESMDGCDSLIHLQVVLQQKIQTTQKKTICGSDSFLWQRTYLDSSGLYRDTLTSIYGCDSIVTLDLLVKESKDPFLTTSPAPGFAGQVININIEGIQREEVSFIDWRGLTIGCDSCMTTTARLDEEVNVFSVTLVDTAGCEYELHVVVMVGLDIFIPNAFHPDGDGINDFFRPYAAGPLFIEEFSIYNRWGNRVYDRKNFVLSAGFKGWDGYHNGKLLKQDTYIYEMLLRLPNGEMKLYKGELMLLH